MIRKIDDFCIGATNETYERYLFNQRFQEDENIETYVAALRTLAKTCNYGQLEESLIRDRMVVGIKSAEARKRLLQDRRLTLDRCIDICKAFENIKLMTSLMKRQNESTEEIQALEKKKQQTAKKNEFPRRGICKFYGERHPFKKELCPAWGKRCSFC